MSGKITAKTLFNMLNTVNNGKQDKVIDKNDVDIKNRTNLLILKELGIITVNEEDSNISVNDNVSYTKKQLKAKMKEYEKETGNSIEQMIENARKNSLVLGEKKSLSPEQSDKSDNNEEDKSLVYEGVKKSEDTSVSDGSKEPNTKDCKDYKVPGRSSDPAFDEAMLKAYEAWKKSKKSDDPDGTFKAEMVALATNSKGYDGNFVSDTITAAGIREMFNNAPPELIQSVFHLDNVDGKPLTSLNQIDDKKLIELYAENSNHPGVEVNYKNNTVRVFYPATYMGGSDLA